MLQLIESLVATIQKHNIEHIIISMVANDLFELFKGLLICKPFYFCVVNRTTILLCFALGFLAHQ